MLLSFHCVLSMVIINSLPLGNYGLIIILIIGNDNKGRLKEYNVKNFCICFRLLSYLIGKGKQAASLSISTVLWTVNNQTKIFQAWNWPSVKNCWKSDSDNEKKSIGVGLFI